MDDNTESKMEEWMDTEQAARYTKHAISSLEKYRTYGGGPRFAKVSRKVLYRRTDLDRWLSANMRWMT